MRRPRVDDQPSQDRSAPKPPNTTATDVLAINAVDTLNAPATRTALRARSLFAYKIGI